MNRFFPLLLIAAMVFVSPVTTIAQQVDGSGAVQSVQLIVTVSGVRSNQGKLLLWVWNGPDGFPKKDEHRYRFLAVDATMAKSGVLTTSFDLPPGIYGVTALHDENSNGKMDTNFLGIPTEGLGTSNNVVTHFRAPSFREVSFEVPHSGREISISMRY